MADPAEMKKGTWGTPVFWFLKGVEGFDTSRANDCAKKLNEKHYDTIAVLKLAEKRDLVEDAGILPGDCPCPEGLRPQTPGFEAFCRAPDNYCECVLTPCHARFHWHTHLS